MWVEISNRLTQFAPMTQDDKMKDALLAQENRVWRALVEGDAETDGAILTEDFLGVYPDGFGTKAEHVGQLDNGGSVAAFRLSQVQLRKLSPEAALLIYRADYLRAGKGTWEAMLITSLWEQRAGQWRNSFSQDTPLTSQTTP